MAPAMKRPASKASRGNPVAKKCRVVGKAIKASDLPKPVRALISDRLVHVFGTYKEDRHEFQNTASALVEKALQDSQSALQKTIDEAQEKKTAQETEASETITAHQNANNASADADKALQDAAASLEAAKNALKEAKQNLATEQQAVSKAETTAADKENSKKKLSSLVEEFFTPVKTGAMTKGLKSSANWTGKQLSKEYASHIEAEFLVCIVRSFSKTAAEWGTFDHLVDKELQEIIVKINESLDGEIAAANGEKDTHSAAVDKCKGVIATAEESLKAAEQAHSEAAAAAKDAKAAAKTAAAAAKTHQQKIDKAQAVLAAAEKALASFNAGPMAAFTEVEANTAPPPEPEAPAEADETPAMDAPAADVAMAPVPAAAAPSSGIAASPGVLGAIARSVSNLVPSPRILGSPRTTQ